MESSCKADEDLEFQLFNFNEVEFLNNVNDIMEGNYQHNETAANFSKDISPDDPISTEPSNMPKEPVDVGVQFQPPLTRDDQTNANPDTIGYENVLLDQLVSSPDRTNESFLHQSSSDANLRQSIYSGFEGNASPHETTSPPFSPLIMEPTHSFPLALAERLAQNEDYSIQPFHSEHGLNSFQTDQVNGHISPAEKLPENGGYSTQPFHSEHGVNSIQTSQVNDRTRLAEKLPQNGDYSTRPLQSEHGVNSSQTDQVNGHITPVAKFPQNDAYSTQSFNSEHGVNLAQTNQVNGRIGLAEKLQQNGSNSTRSIGLTNSVQTNQVNGHNGLIENASQNEGYSTQPLHSHGINSVQTNHVNADIGNSLQAELTGPQRVESADRGKTIMLADQFQQNNFNDNHQELPFPNPFIQSSGGAGYLHGGSTQINQQAPTWVSYKENNFYRPLAPSGQQGTQFQATTNSDPQRYNFMRPSPSTPLRPQQFNNPLQRLNQVPNMPNASGSLLQQSMSTQHSMPSQHMPRYFSNQHDQVSMAPGTYSPQTYSTRLLESSMPLRTPIRPPPHQINPLGVSDLQYRNSLHSRAPMLSSGGNTLEDSDEQRQYNRLDPFNPVTNQFGTRSSSSMLQEALMHSGSYRLPAHQQASSRFSTLSGLPNSDHHYPKLNETSFLPRLQQQQGLFNQTSRPVATSGTSLSSNALNSLLQQETGHTSAPSLSGHRESENSGRRESLPWRGFESGESASSPFKRMRRDSSLAQASSAQQENRNFLSLLNEAGTGSRFGPRPIQNSVYDPKYEGIGLPIDPHLRLFATI